MRYRVQSFKLRSVIRDGAALRAAPPNMNELKLILEYMPYLIPFIGAILIIIFTKKYLFAGMISAEMYGEQVFREKEISRVQEEVAMRLSDIVGRLEAISVGIASERRSGNDRRRSENALDKHDQPGNFE